MKKVLLTGFLLVSVFSQLQADEVTTNSIASAVPEAAVSIGEFKLYTSSSINNFAINYPVDWDIKETAAGVAFVSYLEGATDAFRENVNIYIEDLRANPVSLEQYMEITETNAPKMVKGFNLLDKGTTVVGTEKAFFMIYEGELNNTSVKVKAYTVVKDKKAFVLAYTAMPKDFNKYMATAERIMKSFVLK